MGLALKHKPIDLRLEKVWACKNAAIELSRTLSGFVAAFLIIILASFCLRYMEIQFVNHWSDSLFSFPMINLRAENIQNDNCPVSEILERGYLKVSKIFNRGFLNGILGIETAYAAAPAPYDAMKIIQSADTLEMAVSEKKTFIVGFKNIGTKQWKNTGKNFISIYTSSPKYRASKFQDESWYGKVQLAVLKNEIIKPGEIGYVEFVLSAPEKVGNYNETFKLAAENLAWIRGGEFTIKIKVVEKPKIQAMKLLQSHRGLVLKQGETAEFKVGFKNTGSVKWTERIIARNDVMAASSGTSDDASLFVDDTWVDSLKASIETSEPVEPGHIGFSIFDLKAPYKAGSYLLRFALIADGEPVDGGELEIPVTVTDESVVSNENAGSVAVAELGVEPNIRVGLFYTTEPVSVITNGDYEVRDGNSNLLLTLPPRIPSTLKYDVAGGIYSIEFSGQTYTSNEHLRLVPILPSTFEITSFENRPKWNLTLNDNVFRGTLEYRYSAEADRIWIINDLPLEDYLKGLAESMSTDPLEYQKALVVAARTYAFYYQANGGKHPKQTLTLNASAYDQVYKGYNSELRLKNVSEAVEATKGVVITYEGKVVVTPYFAKSNGRTKTWTQAWGGASKPWLPSRECPYDAAKGRTLLGHGVGMSMYDARDRAKDGFNFQEILNAYYTGIQVMKVY